MAQTTSPSSFVVKMYSSGKNNGNMGRGSRVVTVNGEPLTDIEKIGFTWGYNGRRDRNLAHSIMADYFEDVNVPRELWIIFYDEVLSEYTPEQEWDITGQMISQWIYSRFQVGDDEKEEEAPVKQEESPVITERRKEAETSSPIVLEVEDLEEPEEEEDDEDDLDEEYFDKMMYDNKQNAEDELE